MKNTSTMYLTDGTAALDVFAYEVEREPWHHAKHARIELAEPVPASANCSPLSLTLFSIGCMVGTTLLSILL